MIEAELEHLRRVIAGLVGPAPPCSPMTPPEIVPIDSQQLHDLEAQIGELTRIADELTGRLRPPAAPTVPDQGPPKFVRWTGRVQQLPGHQHDHNGWTPGLDRPQLDELPRIRQSLDQLQDQLLDLAPPFRPSPPARSAPPARPAPPVGSAPHVNPASHLGSAPAVSEVSWLDEVQDLRAQIQLLRSRPPSPPARGWTAGRFFGLLLVSMLLIGAIVWVLIFH